MCEPSAAASIPLSQGKRALVDQEDLAFANQWTWSYEKASAYARRTATLSSGRRITVYLHRALLRAKRHDHVDHANLDKLDCRKGNLRHATVKQNAQNGPVRVNSRSGVTGVNFDATKGKWRAYLTIDGHQRFLGYRDSRDEAAVLRAQAAAEHFGAFAPAVPGTERTT